MQVAVVGAGPAGALAAIRLASAGVAVKLIDRAVAGRERFGETLSPEGQQALHQAGLWDRLPSGIATPCETMTTAWEAPTVNRRSFLTNPYGHAWHVDRAGFDAWLVAEARRAGAEWVPAAVEAARWTCSHWDLSLRRGRSLSNDTAGFLVVATGRWGSFPKSLGRRSKLDALCALGGEVAAGPEKGLLIEAIPAGWWYSAPTPTGALFVALMTDVDLLPRRIEWDATIDELLATAPHTRARCRSPLTITHVAAVASRALNPAAGDGWLAIGDAAIARDPLSGEGVAWALRCGWSGAAAVLSSLAGDHASISRWRELSEAHLRAYLEQRSEAYRAQARWPEAIFWRRRRVNLRVPSRESV